MGKYGWCWIRKNLAWLYVAWDKIWAMRTLKYGICCAKAWNFCSGEVDPGHPARK
jgi:hypothetical protein